MKKSGLLLISMVLAFALCCFASCNVQPFTTIPAGSYTVYHMQQDADDLTQYVVAEKQPEVQLAEGTVMDDVKKTYDGFSAARMNYNLKSVYVYYDRITVSYKFLSGDKLKYHDGSTVQVISGPYGSRVPAAVKPRGEDYGFAGWEGEIPERFGLDSLSFTALSVSQPEGFVYMNGDYVTTSHGEDGAPFRNASPYNPVKINPFYIAETEVTYKRWREVYKWAEKNGYSIYSKGLEGSGELGYEDVANTLTRFISEENGIIKYYYNDMFPVCYYDKTTMNRWGYRNKEGGSETNNIPFNESEVVREENRLDFAGVKCVAVKYNDWDESYSINGAKVHTVKDYTAYTNKKGHTIYLNSSISSYEIATETPDESSMDYFVEYTSADGTKKVYVVDECSYEGIPQKDPATGNLIFIKDDKTYTAVASSFFVFIDGSYVYYLNDMGTLSSIMSEFTYCLKWKDPATQKYSVGDVLGKSYTPDSNLDGVFVRTGRDGEDEFILAGNPPKVAISQSSNYSFGTEPSKDKNVPVADIFWIDAVLWCNAASEMEGLEPVYYVPGTTDFKNAGSASVIREYNKENNKYLAQIVMNPYANGYRLPLEKEWEYAARGGSPNTEPWFYTYAGSNNAADVAWYRTYDKKEVLEIHDVKSANGGNGANYAGLYDMSGNVCEYCWDVYYEDYCGEYCSIARGGSYICNARLCSVSKRDGGIALDIVKNRGSDYTKNFTFAGFRVARSAY